MNSEKTESKPRRNIYIAIRGISTSTHHAPASPAACAGSKILFLGQVGPWRNNHHWLLTDGDIPISEIGHWMQGSELEVRECRCFCLVICFAWYARGYAGPVVLHLTLPSLPYLMLRTMQCDLFRLSRHTRSWMHPSPMNRGRDFECSRKLGKVRGRCTLVSRSRLIPVRVPTAIAASAR